MKADGLTPIAFTDKDGWPAMGTFDIINMRMNGYDFHVRLMAGKARWDGPQVKTVFNTWREILPYTSDGALGLTWQEGAQQLANKEAGMYMLGTFVGQQFTDLPTTKDLDFFAYPVDQPEVGPGLDRRADRRVLHGQEGEQLEGGEGPALATSGARRRRTSTSPPTRTTSARTRTPTSRSYTRAPEEVGAR